MDRLFPRNEHKADRVLRVLLGLGIVSMAFIGPQTPWAWLGMIFVVTGLVGSCPIYRIAGFKTCTDC